MEVWKAVTGGSMCVKQWGTIGLTEEQLSEISNVRAPVVNELNVTDCTTLPKDYTTFAKSKGIHLWASGGAAGPGECCRVIRLTSEPLPAADLHNLLQEFRPKIAALAPSVNTAGLSQLIAVLPDGESYEPSAPGVKVRWVLSVCPSSPFPTHDNSADRAVHARFSGSQHCQGQGLHCCGRLRLDCMLGCIRRAPRNPVPLRLGSNQLMRAPPFCVQCWY